MTTLGYHDNIAYRDPLFGKMGLYIDSSTQDASLLTESSSTSSARPDVESRHPEIEPDGSVDSLRSNSDDGGTDIEDLDEEDCKPLLVSRSV